MSNDQRERLLRDGFCRVAGVLDAAALAEVRAIAAAALARTVNPEHRAQWRSEGSLVPLADHPEFSVLIANPAIGRALAALGLDDLRYGSGCVIGKPPRGSALFRHQDWWGWRHPLSFTDRIAQIAPFFHLTDTTPANGCLRVTLARTAGAIRCTTSSTPTTQALARVDDPDNPAFAPHPDAPAVPVTAGDMVVADARLIHGAHPNASDAERTNITLWLHPGHRRLPESLRAPRRPQLRCGERIPDRRCGSSPTERA